MICCLFSVLFCHCLTILDLPKGCVSIHWQWMFWLGIHIVFDCRYCDWFFLPSEHWKTNCEYVAVNSYPGYPYMFGSCSICSVWVWLVVLVRWTWWISEAKIPYKREIARNCFMKGNLFPFNPILWIVFYDVPCNKRKSHKYSNQRPQIDGWTPMTPPCICFTESVQRV